MCTVRRGRERLSVFISHSEGPGGSEATSSERTTGGKERILVAEDNPDVRAFMRAILTTYGYTVIEARDGEDAVEQFKTNKSIDLLILDSVMPGKNGREAYNEIRVVDPAVKVLFTSVTRGTSFSIRASAKRSSPLYPNPLTEYIPE